VKGVYVLTLTSDAVEAVRTIARASPGMPDAGLRIAAQAQNDGQQGGVEVSVVGSALEGDEVVEEEGARVFVDSELAPYLDDKVLDASVVGDHVQFSVIEQT
jgi:iron-sulfur cluster assembly protein